MSPLRGFDRARWRRFWRVKIQEYLIAAIQNIEVLLRYGEQPKKSLLVKVKSNVSLGETEADVVVHTFEGLRYAKHVSTFRGGPGRPLSFVDIVEKFKDLNEEVIPKGRIEEIAACVRTMETLPNDTALVSLCCRRPVFSFNKKGRK
jgi:hypothetical protein